ncbi:MAG TPA: radical SAM protein [bacterium]|nr:radical SAM protein [bacterium]
MRVFLGNSPWSKPGLYGVRAGSRWPHFERCGDPYMPFPFYLAYATAVLEKAGHDVLLLDGIAERISDDTFFERMQHFKPDLVLLEVSTPSIGKDLGDARRVKETLGKSVPIVFAGPYIEMYRSGFLEAQQDVDFVLMGEYEYTLRDLVEAYSTGKSWLGIAGLIGRGSSGQVVVGERRPLIENLDELPWPARHHLPMASYHDCPGGIPCPSLQMWASRGCPYKCIFCAWPQIMYHGSRYRVRNPKDVVDEIEHCVREYGIQSLYFDDDTFNIGKKRILEICDELKSRRLGLPWAVMARADTADLEMLQAMKGAGLQSIKYGVESASQKLVDACGKALDLKKVEQIVKHTRNLGINFHLTFTFGLPGETRETIRQTIRYAKKLSPDSIQFSIVTPFPGSAYFDMLDKQGFLLSKDWTQYDGSNQAVIRTENLSKEQLEEGLRMAYREWDRHKFWRTFRQGKYLKKGMLHPVKALRYIRRHLGA